MGLSKWIKLPFDRFGPNLKSLLQGDEDDLLEDDPVGEFLSLKSVGTLSNEDEDNTVVVDVVERPQRLEIDNGDAEINEPPMADIQQDMDEEEPGKEKLLGTPAQGDEEQSDQTGYEATSVDVAEDDNVQTLDVEDDMDEVVESTVADLRNLDDENLETDDLMETFSDPQTAEGQSLSIAEDGQSQVEKPQADGEPDSLLDVFKEVQLEDNPISILSRDLEDTDVHSLLEETNRIADKFKKSSG